MIVIHSCLNISSKLLASGMFWWVPIGPSTDQDGSREHGSEGIAHARLIPILTLEEKMYRTCWYSRPECQQMKADRVALAYHMIVVYRINAPLPNARSTTVGPEPLLVVTRVHTEND